MSRDDHEPVVFGNRLPTDCHFCSEAQSVSSQDKTAITAQVAAYSEARQRGDGRTQAMFHTEDAEIWLSTTRKVSRGRAAIEKELDLPADPSRRFRLEVENISFLNPEVAFISQVTSAVRIQS